MKTLMLSCAMTLTGFSTYASSPLNGHFNITATNYQGGVLEYCLALASHGPQGMYRDQGAAYVLTTPAKKYAYAGQYRLFKHELSIAVANIELHPSNLFFKAHVDGGKFTEAVFGSLDYESGTFVAVRRGEGCKQD